MPSPSLEASLAAVEQLIEKVSAALLAADPQSLQQHSTALRDAAAQFARALEDSGHRGPLPAPVQKRVDDIGNMLAVHRESLARLSAGAERQVAGLLPPGGTPSTYGDGRGVQPARAGVARIYKSAG